MEKVFGFRPPPDRVYNDLVAIRKIALKLRSNSSVQYLNFDYFQKRNIEINETWIKNRKDLLIKLLKSFETRLNKRTTILEQRLKKELDRLHAKRLKQFDQLNTKYMRCKNLLEEVNAREKMQFQKSKNHFNLRNDIPKLRLKKERGEGTQKVSGMQNTQPAYTGTYNPSVMNKNTANRGGSKMGGTLRTGTLG
jgi:hypothetical protein